MAPILEPAVAEQGREFVVTDEATAARPADDAPKRWNLRSLEVWIPASLLVIVAVAAIAVPLFGLPDPNAQSLSERNQGLFSDGHLLGTDNLGRDILARVLHGARISLLVGFSSVLIGFVLGGLIGMYAGYRRGKVDAVLMRLLEMVMAFPALVLALIIAAYLGPSVRNVIIAIAFVTVPAYARIARATTLSLRERDFVMASQLIGSKTRHVIFGHLAPNVAISVLAYAFVAIGTAIVVEASLSFLGLGIRPPDPSWGIMIAQGRGELEEGAHQVLVPGAFMFVTVLSLNLLGDALRSRFNHKGDVS